MINIKKNKMKIRWEQGRVRCPALFWVGAEAIHPLSMDRGRNWGRGGRSITQEREMYMH